MNPQLAIAIENGPTSINLAPTVNSQPDKQATRLVNFSLTLVVFATLRNPLLMVNYANNCTFLTLRKGFTSLVQKAIDLVCLGYLKWILMYCVKVGAIMVQVFCSLHRIYRTNERTFLHACKKTTTKPPKKPQNSKKIFCAVYNRKIKISRAKLSIYNWVTRVFDSKCAFFEAYLLRDERP